MTLEIFKEKFISITEDYFASDNFNLFFTSFEGLTNCLESSDKSIILFLKKELNDLEKIMYLSTGKELKQKIKFIIKKINLKLEEN